MAGHAVVVVVQPVNEIPDFCHAVVIQLLCLPLPDEVAAVVQVS